MKSITTLDQEYIEARNNYEEAVANCDWSGADHYERQMDRLDIEIEQAAAEIDYYSDY